MQYMPSEPAKKLSLFRGLRNLGNTCYLNASLQMLGTLTSFTALLKERGGGKLTRSIVSVSQKLANKTDRIAVDPRDVKAAMDEKTDKFVGFEQRDAHEFISDLVDNIHEELQGKDKPTEPEGTDANANDDVGMTSDDALPTDDFCLTVQVCLKCNSCGYSR
jgi:ubiquitin C-terminal hydrolase